MTATMQRRNNQKSKGSRPLLVALQLALISCHGIIRSNALVPSHSPESLSLSQCAGISPDGASRRAVLRWIAVGGATTGWIAGSPRTWADTDIENYLKTGMVAQPMGVSGQGGKSRPETGVVLRDGSEIVRDSRTGDIFSEVLVQSQNGNDKMAVITSFSSPWPVATGDLFGIECRDSKSGDGAYVAVTSPIESGKSLASMSDSFFTKSVFSKTGRFSFYGQPTDIKVKKSTTVSNDGVDYRLIDVSFSTLSQSTQTEIPRRAQIVATIPSGSAQAVMLVGSALASRWKKGSGSLIESTIGSFRAVPAPESSMKLRSQPRSRDIEPL